MRDDVRAVVREALRRRYVDETTGCTDGEVYADIDANDSTYMRNEVGELAQAAIALVLDGWRPELRALEETETKP